MHPVHPQEVRAQSEHAFSRRRVPSEHQFALRLQLHRQRKARRAHGRAWLTSKIAQLHAALFPPPPSQPEPQAAPARQARAIRQPQHPAPSNADE